MIEGRKIQFRKEEETEGQVATYLNGHGKESPTTNKRFKMMNSKAWTASIILIVPVFVIVYLLSKDLAVHERNQDTFLATALPERMFMPQTIPIKTYILITIVTLGIGVVYWLYKVVNLYNAHFKAHLQVEKELLRLMEEEKFV
jgi:hypothetical protein